MASGDFLDLQNNLAIIAGRSSASELDEDLSLCKQVINEALLEVYRPVDEEGSPITPEWARRTVTLRYRGPTAITAGFTQGSRIVTGYAFPDDVAGSLVQVGSKFYRYAGNAGVTGAVIVSGAGTTLVNGEYVPTAYTSGVATTYTAANGCTIVRVTASSFNWEIRGPDSTIYYQVENLSEGDSPVDVAYELVSGASFAPTVTASQSYTLVEPFNEATGTYAATLHHCSQPLPADVAEVVGGVEWVGRGFLQPMTDRETDVGYRSITRPDYYPDYGAGFWGNYSRGVRGTAYPQGDLLFYYTETDALLEGSAVIRRMVVVPLPVEAAVISFRANIVPVELAGDSDRPKIIGDLVTRCLLPIAREKWGITYKKYTGQNQQALVREADKARAILAGMAKPQKRFSGRARPGY